MQSTGQTSTHAVSFVPTHGSQMMYATQCSLNRCSLDRRSLNRCSVDQRIIPALPRSIAIVLLAIMATTASGASLPGTSPPSQSEVEPSWNPGTGWQEMPAYVELFAPPPYRSEYRAFVSPHPIDDVLRVLAADPHVLHPPGAWVTEPLGTSDAFGEGGVYN